MNKWIGSGRLTADTEIKQTQTGKSVCTFTVACDRQYKVEGQPSADFITCVAWEKTAEFVGKYFKKGSRIEIIGEINNRSWEDKDGKKRYTTEIKVSEVHFGEGKNDNSAQRTTESKVVQEDTPIESPEESEESDDKLPF